MIDGIKLRVRDPDIIDQWRNNMLLDWDKNENIRTAKVKKHIAEYDGLNFYIDRWGQGEIAGSIHKYFNGGKDNADDFTMSNLQIAINMLELQFGMNPQTTSIHNLEFGVNIHTEFNPNLLLENLLCFAWNRFNDMQTDNHGRGKQCSPSTQWLMKIYNKGLQYHLPENTLRVEKRIVTMMALNWGKLCLADLLNPELWEHCRQELLSMFNSILINESVVTKNLSKKDQKNYLDTINQSQWQTLDRHKKKRLKKDFNIIISRHGQQQFKPIILKLIHEKCIELANG